MSNARAEAAIVKPSRVVLLVEADDVAADEMATWLTDAGDWVIRCRGPHEPTYQCHGWIDQRCLLADAAHVVVLDMLLDTDAALEGPPAWQLATLYRGNDLPVILLAEPGSAHGILTEPGVTVLPHRPGHDSLVAAVASAFDGRADKHEVASVADIADIWL